MYALIDIPRNANRVQQLRATIQADDFTDLYIALYKQLLKLRGADPSTLQGTREPATTNLDVMQLAALWTKDVLKVGTDHDNDRIAHKRWLDCVSAVHRLADVAHRPDETYPENRAFWGCMRKTAIWLDARKHRPSKWDMWWDSVDEAVDDLPGTLTSVARSVGSAGSSAVDTAGDAAKTIGRGLSGFFGEPVRLVAVLVGGAILLPPVIRALRS